MGKDRRKRCVCALTAGGARMMCPIRNNLSRLFPQYSGTKYYLKPCCCSAIGAFLFVFSSGKQRNKWGRHASANRRRITGNWGFLACPHWIVDTLPCSVSHVVFSYKDNGSILASIMLSFFPPCISASSYPYSSPFIFNLFQKKPCITNKRHFLYTLGP